MKNNITKLEIKNCVGCRSCLQSCPKECIIMQENNEGFYFPYVEEDKCIECGLCIKHCPILTPGNLAEDNKDYYGLYVKDKNLLLSSSSGGAFVGIASYVLEKEGVVFGCSYDDNLIAKHIVVSVCDDLIKLQGSKYVASDTNDTYTQVKKILDKSNKMVLYTGTPCQIAGLKAFLGKDYTNLYTIDLLCHGTPSQKLFSKYIEWLGKKMKGKIIYYGFRDKDVGGWSCGGKFKTKTKTKTKTLEASCDPYYASFLRGETYRESCYVCKYANMKRVGDITIGDFWGVEKYYPNIHNENGVSCCIVNSKKGKELFNFVSNKFEYFEVKETDLVKNNKNLLQPTLRPNARDYVYKAVENDYFDDSFLEFDSMFEYWVKKMVRIIFPKQIVLFLKKMIRR